VNLEGNLIGLNVAIFKEGQGIGFAIPVKRISESLGEIFTPEILRGLWFGAQFKQTTNGLTVARLEADSPAAKGGLKEGDMVLRANTIAPKSVFSLNREVIAAGENREVIFQIRRGGTARQATVRLIPEEKQFNTTLIRKKTGLTIRQLTPEDFVKLGFNIANAFLIADIERGSPADHAGFQRGLILERIDGRAADSITAVARLLAAKNTGDAVRLGVLVPRPPRREEVELKVR
jgi:serine protease Do